MKLPWCVHATLFVASLCTSVLWSIFLFAVAIAHVFYGIVISGNSALVFILCGEISASIVLFEMPNYLSGYLFTLGKNKETIKN